MKKYYIEEANVYYLTDPDADFIKKFGKCDTVVRSRKLIKYIFTESDILPHEGLAWRNAENNLVNEDLARDCYTVYDGTFPKGWFWIRRDGVQEI